MKGLKKRSFLCVALALMLIVMSIPAMAEVGGKLVIWEHTSQFEGAGKAVIEGFKAKYPNVEVDFQVKTSDQYYNLLATATQAGEAPDLFWTNGTLTTNMAAYVEQGLLMDLTGQGGPVALQRFHAEDLQGQRPLLVQPHRRSRRPRGVLQQGHLRQAGPFDPQDL